MSVDVAVLLGVLDEARGLLARPGNDFSWSSFGDAETALSELDEMAGQVRGHGLVPVMLPLLFAPTGPIQEVALSSGWGDEFLALATRFDDAIR